LGRERNRTWKYLHLSVACIIFISLAGCSALKEMEARKETREHLITARESLDKGDYEGCLKENEKVLSLSDNAPPADEALFNAGLVYAHYGYTKRDHQKSLDYFNRLVKAFPQSPFAGQGRIWIGMLQENERINKENERLGRENERISKEIEELNRTIRKFQQENQRLSKEIEELNRTIRKSTQVDIEIDEKKKELSK
jgi:outer membrane protein assembly factor BamD (BamD/ComL family)